MTLQYRPPGLCGVSRLDAICSHRERASLFWSTKYLLRLPLPSSLVDHNDIHDASVPCWDDAAAAAVFVHCRQRCCAVPTRKFKDGLCAPGRENPMSLCNTLHSPERCYIMYALGSVNINGKNTNELITSAIHRPTLFTSHGTRPVEKNVYCKIIPAKHIKVLKGLLTLYM